LEPKTKAISGFQSSVESCQSAILRRAQTVERIKWDRRALWVASAMVAMLMSLARLAVWAQAPDARDGDPAAAASTPADPAGPLGTPSSDHLFQELLSHNQWRQDHLKGYSVKRVYRVTNGKGTLSAEEQVSLEFEAPGIKRYTVTSEKGSAVVRRLVFKRLLDSEVETAGGRSRTDSSISPANYRFQVLGEEQLDGRPCYMVEATPTRNAKYLFRGKVWIDSQDFAVAKIDGEPATNPSWWTKKIHFVRRYQKIGDFWLPRSDESVNQVRIFGTHILTIEHQDYEVAGTGALGIRG
jgi:hypothetical protein